MNSLPIITPVTSMSSLLAKKSAQSSKAPAFQLDRDRRPSRADLNCGEKPKPTPKRATLVVASYRETMMADTPTSIPHGSLGDLPSLGGNPQTVAVTHVAATAHGNRPVYPRFTKLPVITHKFGKLTRIVQFLQSLVAGRPIYPTRGRLGPTDLVPPIWLGGQDQAYPIFSKT